MSPNFMNLSKISSLTIVATMLSGAAVADINAIQLEALNEYYQMQETSIFMGVLIGCGQVYQDMRPEVNSTLFIMVPELDNERITRNSEKIEACIDKVTAPTRNQCSTLNKLLTKKVSFRDPELQGLGIVGMPMMNRCF